MDSKQIGAPFTSPIPANRDEILARIATGARLVDLAQQFGYSSPSAIYNRLRDDPEYHVAREIGNDMRMEIREKELESADDSVKVARARELLSHARWRAEREHPHRWGQRTHQTVEHVGDLGDKLRKARERAINAAPQTPVIEHDEQVSDAQVIDNK